MKLGYNIVFFILFNSVAFGQNWNQILKVAASDRALSKSSGRLTSDNFGQSIAISGDYAIVGAYLEDEDADGGNTVNGSGSAVIYKNIAGTWTQIKKITASTRAIGDRFGVSVALSGDYAIVGAYNEDEDASEGNTLSESGSAYIFKKDQGGVDNWGQIKKITASTRATSDNFGVSVAMSGDYAIVGAYYEDEDAAEANTLSSSGSAYIFKKNQGGVDNWGQIKKITASTRAADDFFGSSVAISGDYVIVGAYQEDEDASEANTLSESGSAYIFKKDQGGVDNWGQIKKITASTRAATDNFGFSVAISGDYAIVGAYYEDEDASEANTLLNSGSAYVFKKDQGGVDNWGQVKKITASTRATDDWFGFSVAISGDYAIVGAYSEDEDASEANTISASGSTYIFKKDQGGVDNWGQIKKNTASSRLANDFFGWSVAISGDYFIVGAIGEDEDENDLNSINSAGSSYLFNKNQGGIDNWGQYQKIVLWDKAVNDFYGVSVAISGDYAIVGVNQEDEDAGGANVMSNAGAAYILKNIAGTWTEIKKITQSTRFIGDNFGQSVAISGDYAIVGAYFEDEDAAEANTLSATGSAYIFKKDQGGVDNWGQIKKITANTRAMSDFFGYSVAISGDYAVVGAYQEDEDASEANTLSASGSAYIFKKDQGGVDNWGQIKKITANARLGGDQFGYSVAIDGSYVIVGSVLDDEDASDANTLSGSGSAYIFKKDQGGVDNWGQIKKITASTRAIDDQFGFSVAISGDYAIVGARNEDEDVSEANTLSASGSAYIFKKDQGGVDNWGQIKKITASTRAIGDNFGWSVSISGDYAIVSAYQEDEDVAEANTLTGSGSAYILAKGYGGVDNWGQVQKAVASTRATNDLFGYSVAINGDYAIVGAYNEDEDASEANNIPNSGSVYVFNRITSLPIKLLCFNAEKINETTVKTYWQTALEINNDYFTIERSIDAENFQTVGIVDGAGNSSSVLSYELIDNNFPTFNFSTLYYRLKQTDFNGSFSYSNIVAVNLANNKGSLSNFNVFPNPTTSDNINISINADENNEVLIIVRDVLGKELYAKAYVTTTNPTIVKLSDGFSLSAGVYTITASSKEELLSRKVIIK